MDEIVIFKTLYLVIGTATLVYEVAEAFREWKAIRKTSRQR